MSLLGWFTLSSDRCCDFPLKLERLFFEKTWQNLGAQSTAFQAILFFVDGSLKRLSAIKSLSPNLPCDLSLTMKHG